MGWVSFCSWLKAKWYLYSNSFSFICWRVKTAHLWLVYFYLTGVIWLFSKFCLTDTVHKCMSICYRHQCSWYISCHVTGHMATRSRLRDMRRLSSQYSRWRAFVRHICIPTVAHWTAPFITTHVTSNPIIAHVPVFALCGPRVLVLRVTVVSTRLSYSWLSIVVVIRTIIIWWAQRPSSFSIVLIHLVA